MTTCNKFTSRCPTTACIVLTDVGGTPDFGSGGVTDEAGMDEDFGFALWSHAVVPEPRTILLLLAGLVFLAFRARKAKSPNART